MSTVSVSNADKYVHATFHFVFTILWATYLCSRSKSKDIKIIALQVVGMSFLFGAAIEVAQGLFTATRQADILDVLANITGSLIGALVFWIAKTLRFKPNQ